MSGDASGYAFVILLRDETQAQAVAATLKRFQGTDNTVPVAFLIPPVRGVDFFTDPDDIVDRWWGEAVSGAPKLIYVAEHEPGMEAQIKDDLVDYCVGIRDAGTGVLYPSTARVVMAKSPVQLAKFIHVEYLCAGLFGGSKPVDFGEARGTTPPEAKALRTPSTRAGYRPASLFSLDPDDGDGRFLGSVPNSDAADASTPHPFELLAERLPLSTPAAVVPVGGEGKNRRRPVTRADMIGSVTPGRTRPRKPRAGVRVTDAIKRVLGSKAKSQVWEPPSVQFVHSVSRLKPLVIGFAGHKGGVGKTAHAAGVAIEFGRAASAIGHGRAALVDANLNNPDQWDMFGIRSGAVTVRQAMDRIVRGEAPSQAIHAATPGLTLYPESKEPAEYTKAEIDALAGWLKRRHPVIVLDFANTRPSLSGGPAARALQYWLPHIDVLCVPAQTDLKDLQAVLAFLSIPNLPKGIVVPYIEKRLARLRKDPKILQMVDVEIGGRCEVVRLPDDDRAALAVLCNVPAADLSPALGTAYQNLAGRIIAVAARSRGIAV